MIRYSLCAISFTFLHTLPLSRPTLSAAAGTSLLSAFHTRHNSIRSVTYFLTPVFCISLTQLAAQYVTANAAIQIAASIARGIPFVLVTIQFSLLSKSPSPVAATIKTISNGC